MSATDAPDFMTVPITCLAAAFESSYGHTEVELTDYADHKRERGQEQRALRS